MSIKKERRCEPRAELHRIWTVSVQNDRIGHHRAQLVDYNAAGMKLALDGCMSLNPGERIAIHYPGTTISYEATVEWCQDNQTQTIAGVYLLETGSSKSSAPVTFG